VSDRYELDLCQGPPCPRCGCRDCTVSQWPPDRGPNDKPTWFAQGRAKCRHCGMPFTFREVPDAMAPPIGEEADYSSGDSDAADIDDYQSTPMPPRDTAYPVRACPECGSPEVKVESSPKAKAGAAKIRYHICRDCHAKFKSIDRRHLTTPLRIVS
jgi:Zn finger protein HypA/HybF involved in hydrogenase expression